MHTGPMRIDNNYAGSSDLDSLVYALKAIHPHDTLNQVSEIFLLPELHSFLSLPIVNEYREPIGIISRFHFMQVYLKPFGRELFGNKPICELMNRSPLVVEVDTPINMVSEYITHNVSFPVVDDFIICRNGKYIGTGIVMDVLKVITESKFRDYDKALNQKIEQLKYRTQELEAASKQADQANNTKSRFLASMSHELRTPLNAILGYSDLLIEQAQDASHEYYIQDLNKIHNAGSALLGIINEILDLSRIEAGKLEINLQNFYLADTLESVIEIMQPNIQKHNNNLIVDIKDMDIEMYSDPKLVRQSSRS